MAKKPKLTPTFADQVAEQPPQIPEGVSLATFPASRVVGTQYASMGSFMGFPFTPTATPVASPQREKVAIIGTAPSSRMLAPFQDMSWDIWGCSPGNMGVLSRVDAWFEIHGNLLWPQYADAYGKNYIKWLSEQKFPVYLHDEPWHPKYFPHALKFPARDLVKKFGRRWFGSSFAWMMAFAIDRGYKEIGLFGVDMASKDEYILQRQSFYHWLEKAESLGIKISIPRESDLAQPPALYGYSDMSPIGRKLHARESELGGRSEAVNQEVQKALAQIEGLKANKVYIDGAREDVQYMRSIWPAAQDEWVEWDKVPIEVAVEVVKAAGYQVTKQEEKAGLKESGHA